MAEPQQILVVEDDVTLLNIVRFNLRAMGFAVKAVISGSMAWKCAQQKHYDLVITDCVVPGMSGEDLCCRLRDDTRYRETPLIMITSLTPDLEHAVLKEKLKLAALLIKPFEIKKLLDVVADCLVDSVTT